MKRIFLVLTAIFVLTSVNAQSLEETVWYVVGKEKKFDEITEYEGLFSLFTSLASSKLIFKKNREFCLNRVPNKDYEDYYYCEGTFSYDFQKQQGNLILKDGTCQFRIINVNAYQKMIIRNWNNDEDLILIGKDKVSVTNNNTSPVNKKPSYLENKTSVSSPSTSSNPPPEEKKPPLFSENKIKISNEQMQQGDKYMERKEYDLASKMYRMAYTENPNNCYALYKESVAYILWGGNYDKAISNLLKVLECGSTSSEEYKKIDAGECYYYIGYAYSKKGDRVKTKEFMQKAAEAGSKKAQEWFHK